MKKIISVLLTLCMLMGMVSALAEETWTCPACNTENSGNFCGECGGKKIVTWMCKCGTENTGNFCGECGSPKSNDWTCPNCGQVNESKFCGECGTERGAKPAKPTEVPEAQPKAVNGLVGTAQVEFHYQDSRAKIFVTTDDVIYAKDYNADIHYYVSLNIENTTAEEKTYTISAKVNGKNYEFNPYTHKANSNHGFYISSVALTPGTHEIEWLLDDQVVAAKTLTVKDEHSDFYSWLNANIATTVTLSVWDDLQDTRVKDNVAVGYTSELGMNERFAPRMKVTNNDTKATESMFIAFSLNGDTWWWSDEKLDAGKTMNYLHTSMDQGTADSEVILFINGIWVNSGVVHVIDDAQK